MLRGRKQIIRDPGKLLQALHSACIEQTGKMCLGCRIDLLQSLSQLLL